MSAFSNNIFDLLNEDGYKPAPVAAPAKEANKPTTEAKPASNDKRGKSNGGNSRPFIPFILSFQHACYSILVTLRCACQCHILPPFFMLQQRWNSNLLTAWKNGNTRNDMQCVLWMDMLTRSLCTCNSCSWWSSQRSSTKRSSTTWPSIRSP